MQNINDELLMAIRTELENCAELLGKIASTCCMPERGPKMQGGFAQLQNTLVQLDQVNTNKEEGAHRCIESIGVLGAKVGLLYATCCTETREPLYQSMFHSMNTAHTKLWQILGHSH